jgi:hypothetical protein
VRPAVVANQFAQAIAERDYTKADTLVRLPNDIQSWKVDFESFASWSKGAETLEMKVSWQAPDWRDWLFGRRRGSCIAVRTSDGIVNGSQFPLIATATSIDVGKVTGAGGFQYKFSAKLDDWVEYFQE